MPLPSGTVTFLFTDIEDSARLWEERPQAMHAGLVRHDRLLRQVIADHQGVVFKTIGDAFCAAFADAPQAVAAALEAQRVLTAEPGPEALPLRVRMALNTGAVESRDNDYFGLPLNRVARLLAIGHGGQILLSQAVYELVKETLPEGASFGEHGLHRLKDLGQPECVFQLLHPSLPADFPPLRSLSNPALPNNLPQQVTSFIGREKEIAEVKALLGKTRLLTLIGSGGGGKTRLGLQVAAELLEGVGDGVWLVELAPLNDRNGVSQTVANVLGVREEMGRPLLQTLVDYLKSRKLLLLLDNCEHLLDVCTDLADTLLKHCPEVQILATSREAMGIAGEQTFRVPSLSLPPRPAQATVESVEQYEAVRLFVVRATAVLPAFTITNAPVLAQLCVRLDGIPLAIELAAARVRSLSVAEINGKLDNRFRLLTGGSRTALPRQQTLRALIDWSYDLLQEPEKMLLRRLAVFAGGWTLEAVEQICIGDAEGSGPSIEEWETLDLLTSLADKSLVVAEPQEGRTRYRLLESVRQYAHDRLLEEGTFDAMRRRHQAFFLALAEEAEPKLLGPEQVLWLERLEREHDNLRAALEGSGDAEAALRIAGTLWRFWQVRGYFQEGRERLSTALAGAPASTPTVIRAKALNGAGVLARSQGDYATARAWVEESVDLYREAEDKLGIATSLSNLGLITYAQGDYSTARTLHAESLTLRRELGDKRGIATSLNNLGLVALEQDDHIAAQAMYFEAVGLYRDLGDKGGMASALNNEGNVAHKFGDFVTARAIYEESLALRRELGDRQGIATSLTNLGAVAQNLKDYTGAHRMYSESLILNRELGNRGGIAYALAACAELASVQQQSSRAAHLWGATQALRDLLDAPRSPSERIDYDREVARTRAVLGETAFNLAWLEGAAFTMEHAIDYALEEIL
ncbi:MAG: Adenylate/guanylate cyclase [Chthonomonadales bacterium]|nr:Adenylate/guanylate cyclase [Chthonomonadales bacterium]